MWTMPVCEKIEKAREREGGGGLTRATLTLNRATRDLYRLFSGECSSTAVAG